MNTEMRKLNHCVKMINNFCETNHMKFSAFVKKDVYIDVGLNIIANSIVTSENWQISPAEKQFIMNGEYKKATSWIVATFLRYCDYKPSTKKSKLNKLAKFCNLSKNDLENYPFNEIKF